VNFIRIMDMDGIIKRCERLFELNSQDEYDDYAQKQLRKVIYARNENHRNRLTSLEYFINGKEYTSLLDALYHEEYLNKIKIKFLKPVLDGDWNFSKPTREVMEKAGRGLARTFDFDPDSLNRWAAANRVKDDKVMIRAYISDFFVPISIKTKSQYHHAQDIPRMYEPQLKKFRGIWTDARKGVLPLEIRLCAYTPTDRYTYVIDTLKDVQRPHSLHKVPFHYCIDRKPIEYMMFDTVIANIELPPLSKSMFEFIFECGEVTVSDLAHKFEVSNQIAKNNLSALQSKGLVNVRKELYYDVSLVELKKRADKLCQS